MSSDSIVENKILRCIDEGLEVLGRKGMLVLQRHLEQDIGLRREDIPERPQVFCKELGLIFGERGSRMIIDNIVRKLLRSFNLKKKSDLTLAGAIEMIRARNENRAEVDGNQGN